MSEPSQAALAAASEMVDYINKGIDPKGGPSLTDISGIIDKHMAPAWIPSDLQVEAYIRAKLADAHKLNDYASVSVGIYASKGNDREMRCSVDFGTAGSMSTSTTLTDAIAKIGDEYSSEKKAAHLRQEAERLNREAEALEQEGAES